MNKLTEGDKRSLQYFWEEKSDLETMICFEELVPLIEKEYPEVMKAWLDYKISIRTLNAVIKNMVDDNE